MPDIPHVAKAPAIIYVEKVERKCNINNAGRIKISINRKLTENKLVIITDKCST